jgi:hypothetical protein
LAGSGRLDEHWQTARRWERQVRNIGGNDIKAQAEFIAALFEVAA